MHILIIADPIDEQYAGIHVYTKNLVSGLSKFISSSDQLSIIRTKKTNDFTGIAEYIIPKNRFLPYDIIRTFYKIPKLINSLNPDVVIEPAHFGPFNLKKSILRVTVIHDLTPILFPQFHTFLSAEIQSLFLPRILKKTDLIIANSKCTKKDITNKYPISEDKITFIYPGIQKIETNNQILSSSQKPYILFVGTIEPRKNIESLLKAFEIFCSSNNDLELILVGKKGWKNEGVLDLISNSKYKSSITTKGYVSDKELASLYSNAFCFVYPSFYEGFGFPVLEAMSAGIPVITSNNSSLKEVVGSAAILVNERNPDEIAAAIKSLDKKTIDTMRALGKKQSDKYSWEKFASEFYSTLRNQVGIE